MKPPATQTLAALALMLAMLPLGAQEAPPAAEPAQRQLTAAQEAFSNLPEERRREFLEHLNEAGRLFQQKRIFESLDEANRALRIFEDSAEVHNLIGSCYVEIRNFERALESFERALELADGSPNVMFNIAEVRFVTGEWEDALVLFRGILAELPQEGTPLGRLVEFKEMLCLIRLDRLEEAEQLAAKHDPVLDDSPYYYYAQAALAYQREELIEAEQWLARAARVFQNPNILAPWQDTLIEFGYIKSFYGGEIGAEG